MSELVRREPLMILLPAAFHSEWFFLFSFHLLVSVDIPSHTWAHTGLERCIFSGTYHTSPLYRMKVKVEQEGWNHISFPLALYAHFHGLNLEIYRDTETSIWGSACISSIPFPDLVAFPEKPHLGHTQPYPVQLIQKSQNSPSHISKITA